jgi:chloramphenicol-sensitive protein RarD
VLFTRGARRLRLATIGIMQYIAPSGHFLLAVFLWGEPFTWSHVITYGSIWVALAIYSWDMLRRHVARPEAPTPP